MGCGTSHSKSSKSLPFSVTLSKFEINTSLSSTTLHRQRSCGPSAFKDFWGSNPYYVLSNRLVLLSNSVGDRLYFSKILLSLEKILVEAFDCFDENREVKLDKFAYEWIMKYEHSESLLKTIGMEIHGRKLICIDGVTQMNIAVKIKEIGYFSRRMHEGGIRSFTVE